MYGKVWGRVTCSELEEGEGGHYLYLLPEKACSCSVTVNMSAHDLRRVSMYTRTIKEEEEDDPWADISPFKVSLSLPIANLCQIIWEYVVKCRLLFKVQRKLIERGSQRGKGIAVFTSGGDSQGMNAAVRAVVRSVCTLCTIVVTSVVDLDPNRMRIQDLC